MSCQYCGGSHSAFDPCPEMLAAAQATVTKHTLGTHDLVTIQQLKEAYRVIEGLMKQSKWFLISPDGEMWAEREPAKLISVLLTRLNVPALRSRVHRSMMVKLDRTVWERDIRKLHPDVVFTEGDKFGSTYGDPGTVTAHIGPDMQADVVGVWVPGSYCSIDGRDYGVTS